MELRAAMPTPDAHDDLAARRRRARRTALTIAVVALCIYAGFILRGVLLA
ncbi:MULTISPECIES: hypothetical protein [unclassified Luteimonas]|nr:hypothetical protein [Luteimonas sp. RC10]MBB3344840.1 hypothetical protein [Luteimonas sp. RC10]